MGVPQIIILALVAVEMLLQAHSHGKPRGPSDFWTAFIAHGLLIALLGWGGFFTV